ncbi:MAG: CNNM domain-containing protein [Verrucomicrobiota bacterium]|nr:CNNM domain-containing protein [Verrucomicrobiota bacterium]
MTWFAIAACWTLSFLFAGIEAGLLSVDPVRLRHQVNQRQRAAMRLNRLAKHPERLLITVLLITNMADILALLLLTRTFVQMCGAAGYFVAVIVALPIYLFLLAVLPKSLFRRFPLRALAALGGLLQAVSVVLWPLLEVGDWLGRALLPRRAAENRRLFAAREELKQIAVQGEHEGALTATERAMIHNVVDFRNIRACDVMVPIAQAVTVTPSTTVADLLQLSGATGIDRLPVISETGQAVGLVNVLDILLDPRDARPLGTYIRRIVTAEEREPAYRIIRRLRAARIGLAAITNQQKQLIGIATGEELIKRLVQSA